MGYVKLLILPHVICWSVWIPRFANIASHSPIWCHIRERPQPIMKQQQQQPLVTRQGSVVPPKSSMRMKVTAQQPQQPQRTLSMWGGMRLLLAMAVAPMATQATASVGPRHYGGSGPSRTTIAAHSSLLFLETSPSVSSATTLPPPPPPPRAVLCQDSLLVRRGGASTTATTTSLKTMTSRQMETLKYVCVYIVT
jgi:hypothetical protein